MPRDGHRCARPAITVDHIVARALGGSDELTNLRAACVPCNMAAGARLRGVAGIRLVNAHNAVLALVAALDQVGAPVGAGRRRARSALARLSSWRGRRIRSDDLDAACAYRAARGPLTRWPTQQSAGPVTG